MSSPNVEEVGEGAPSGIITAPVPPPKPTSTRPSKKLLPDQVLLSTYVPPLERVHHPTGMMAPDPEGVLEISHRWNPFNQVESSVAHMRDLYSNYFWIPVVAFLEQYTIPLPIYMDKDAF